MTIGIVIPLKSKNISRNWSVTSQALKNTLASLENQSDNDFIVIVAGHDCPDFLLNNNNEKIKFKKVNFLAPNKNASNFEVQHLINDKNLKVISGLYELREESLSYIFQLDSDDLVHRNFVATIKSKKGFDAIIIQGGYLYYKSSNRYIESSQLDQYCGSTIVARAGSFKMPDKIDIQLIHQIPWTKYRHQNVYLFFEQDTNQKVLRLTDKLVAYVLASGDNFSDRWRDNWFRRLKWNIKPYIKGRRVNNRFKFNFHL